MSLNLGLQNKLVVISGSTEGIGAACASLFLSLGANVVINGRDAAKTATSADRILASAREVAQQNGNDVQKVGKAYPIAADLSKKEEADRFIEEVRKIGTVDVLVNNVGIFNTKKFED
ncbi:hypothetical protein HK104_006773, partial [Borealophlyctis nickersoniae]